MTLFPVVGEQSLKRWVSEQVDLLMDLSAKPELKAEIAQLVRLFDGDTKKLPVAKAAAGWISAEDISTWTDPPDEVLLASDFDVERLESLQLSLHDNVLAVHSGMPVILQTSARSQRIYWPSEAITKFAEDGMRSAIEGLVIEALAAVWNVPEHDVYKVSSDSRAGITREIGTVAGGQPYESSVRVIRNPRVLAATHSEDH